jgi:hypothetical protein
MSIVVRVKNSKQDDVRLGEIGYVLLNQCKLQFYGH